MNNNCNFSFISLNTYYIFLDKISNHLKNVAILFNVRFNQVLGTCPGTNPSHIFLRFFPISLKLYPHHVTELLTRPPRLVQSATNRRKCTLSTDDKAVAAILVTVGA